MYDFEMLVDSDGVLCDFDGYVEQHLGSKVSEFQPKGRFWQAMTHHDATVQKFFRNLPKMPDADVLMAYLTANYSSVRVLTACGNTPTDAKQQKIDWYAEHYPGIECIVVSKSPDKAVYAHSRAILIDDRSKSIDPWIAAGGIGILHTSAEDTIRQLQALKVEQ